MNSSVSFISRSWCYKTFFGGNLDFPKIKKLNKVCFADWTCTKMLKQCYFQLNYIQTLFICSKMVYSCCFSLGGNLDFLDFLQKKFYNIDYRKKFFECSSRVYIFSLMGTPIKPSWVEQARLFPKVVRIGCAHKWPSLHNWCQIDLWTIAQLKILCGRD